MDIYDLPWVNVARVFSIYVNAKMADLDSNHVVIIDYNVETCRSVLKIVDESPTGRAMSSDNERDWPILDAEFGCDEWRSFVRDHERESRAMFRKDEAAKK